MSEVIKIVLEVDLDDKPEWDEDCESSLDYEEYQEMTSEDVFKHSLGVLLEQSAWDEDTVWHCTKILHGVCHGDFNILPFKKGGVK